MTRQIAQEKVPENVPEYLVKFVLRYFSSWIGIDELCRPKFYLSNLKLYHFYIIGAVRELLCQRWRDVQPHGRLFVFNTHSGRGKIKAIHKARNGHRPFICTIWTVTVHVPITECPTVHFFCFSRSHPWHMNASQDVVLCMQEGSRIKNKVGIDKSQRFWKILQLEAVVKGAWRLKGKRGSQDDWLQQGRVRCGNGANEVLMM